MRTLRRMKWTGLLLFAFAVLGSRTALSADLDVIKELQKQRVKICQELQNGDEQAVIKVLNQTGELIEKQIKKSADPALMRRTFASATRRLDLIYQSDKIRKPQLNYIMDVYRSTISGIRTQYRDEIRRQILVEKNLKSDFFENDCKRLV